MRLTCACVCFFFQAAPVRGPAAARRRENRVFICFVRTPLLSAQHICFLPAAFTTRAGRRKIGISCLHSELAAGFVVGFYHTNIYIYMYMRSQNAGLCYTREYGKPVYYCCLSVFFCHFYYLSSEKTAAAVVVMRLSLKLSMSIRRYVLQYELWYTCVQYADSRTCQRRGFEGSTLRMIGILLHFYCHQQQKNKLFKSTSHQKIYLKLVTDEISLIGLEILISFHY